MPEPFKNVFNQSMIAEMATTFLEAMPGFNVDGFTTNAGRALEHLELKERSDQITQAMCQFFPKDFRAAAKILSESLGPELVDDSIINNTMSAGISGWGIMPMTHFVALRGMDHLELSLNLLKEMTKRFTSEFGIRFFLIEKETETLAIMREWVTDPNPHVRRLVSEGTRPRLPWAMQIRSFMTDPSPVLPLLEALRDDESEYVRRSVSNHLNDISKDHPDLLGQLALDWMDDKHPTRAKLLRHACRSLLKSGHPNALKAFSYGKATFKTAELQLETPMVNLGAHLEFTLTLESDAKQDQPLMIDFIIHHQKANGKTSPKVFKWKTLTLAAKKTISATKKHPIKKISTRVYYAGEHEIEIVINGISVARQSFQLTI